MPNNQNNEKKYASLSTLQTFLDNLKTKFSNIGHKHTISDLTDYTVDSSLSSTSTNPVQNKVLNAEFDKIAVSMRALDLALDGKSDSAHSHNDLYYTQSQLDTKLASKSDKTHNHDSAYDTKGAAADSLASAKSYTDTKVANLASTSTVDTKISTHNTATTAHSDIRDLISGLTTRLNALANSDDTTLDQLSEIVAYIKNNKSLIDGITTSKVNVADIVNNLTTNVTNKPLSAAQGVAIKTLIDDLQEELDSHTHTDSEDIYIQNEEPTNAEEGTLWIDLDAEGTVGGTGANTGGGSVNIDTTLTKSGQSADAKAVGDALATKQPLGDYATEDYVDNAISSIDIPSGADGKSAYAYAQEAGYTGTEEEFAEKLAQEPLIGTTMEITPSQVLEAITTGRDVLISHSESAWGGEMKFSSFSHAVAFDVVLASGIFMYASEFYIAELYGDYTNGIWNTATTKLARYTDVPTALKNPYALTINGKSYDGSAAVNMTDEINSLIDTKLSSISNAEEVAF